MSLTWTDVVRVRGPVWFDDPLEFCNEVFFEKPREWQPEVIDAVRDNPWTAIVACRNAGKTRLAAYIALWFLCTRPFSLVLTIAPTWGHVEDAIWADIRQLWSQSYLPQIYPNWVVLKTEIQTDQPKWRAFGLASNEPTNIEGRHAGDAGAVLIVLDESQKIEDEFFDSVQGMLGGKKGRNKLIAIGRGGVPAGWFYRACSGIDPLFTHRRRIRADELDRLKEDCERECKRLGAESPTYRQHWLAEFTGADTGSIIAPDKVDEAIERFRAWEALWPPDKRRKWRKILALDPAGGGSDECVLTYRYGPIILQQVSLRNSEDTMHTAGEVVARAREWKPDVIVVDSIGLGKGIYDRVRELYSQAAQIIPFVSQHTARDSERFADRKSEVVFHLRDLLEQKEIAFADIKELREQLPGWTYEYTPKGKTKVKDPNDSPDWADSAMLAFSVDTYSGGLGTTAITLY